MYSSAGSGIIASFLPHMVTEIRLSIVSYAFPRFPLPAVVVYVMYG